MKVSLVMLIGGILIMSLPVVLIPIVGVSLGGTMYDIDESYAPLFMGCLVLGFTLALISVTTCIDESFE